VPLAALSQCHHRDLRTSRVFARPRRWRKTLHAASWSIVPRPAGGSNGCRPLQKKKPMRWFTWAALAFTSLAFTSVHCDQDSKVVYLNKGNFDHLTSDGVWFLNL
jgi:hypothetical protein